MAFFECKKCKRRWQYKIEKCPFCFEKTERLISKKFKVIGEGKTTIPSVFHQNVPYSVAVVEDENKNRFLLKREKEVKIGEEFEIEKAKQKSAVFLWRVKYDFEEPIEFSFETFDQKVNSQTKVLILPTIEKASHSYFCDNTTVEFLEATINFLIKKGVKPENIKVGGQSFDEQDFSEKIKKSQIQEVCQKYQVEIVDFSKEDFLQKGDLKLCKRIFEANLILNLPILKMSKCQATENLFFFLQKENFLAQKYLFETKEILEKLEKILPPIFTLAEAWRVQSEKKIVFYLNLFLASFDHKNVDRVFFEIVGKKEIPEWLKMVDLNQIEIKGRQINEVKFQI